MSSSRGLLLSENPPEPTRSDDGEYYDEKAHGYGCPPRVRPARSAKSVPVSLGFLVNELVLRDDHRHLYFWFPFFNILMTIRLIEVYTEVANRITGRPFISS